MSLEYSITYSAENQYENWIGEAFWQFLIIPLANDTQSFISVDFSNSINADNQFSTNGYGFRTIRVHPKQRFKLISFEAVFKLIKQESNPFDFNSGSDPASDFERIGDIDFKVDFEPFLKATLFTHLPPEHHLIFQFDRNLTVWDNLQALNHWTYLHIQFKAGVTSVHTTLAEVINMKHGVCQDFAHLFCAISRSNGIPTRYVSGYLHQGIGYLGDSQMHAWVEAFLPSIGWVGFDPTNNLLANSDYIKIAHGKDYSDCSPLKGVIYGKGSNETSHTVQVSAQQQQ